MALLGGIEADADEPLAPGQRLVQRALGRRLVEMAQEAAAQCRADAKRPFGVLHGGPQAVDHRAEGDATIRMALWIQKDLDMRHIQIGIDERREKGRQYVKI